MEQEILAAGHSVCILTTVSGDSKNTHLDGEHPNRRVLFLDNAIPIPFLHDPNQPDLTYQLGFSLSRKVRLELEDFEPTIFHITCTDCTALHLIQYARTKEIPLMATFHSNIPDYMDHYPGLGWLKHILKAFFRHQYNFMQALYVPTPFIMRHLEEDYQMDKCTNMQVWGRGVDVDRFNPSHRNLKFRRNLGIGDHDVVVCWVGRLVPEKRVDIFCDTIRRLHERNVSYHALIVGAGPGEEEIKSLPKATFCGWLNAEELATAYASSDVFLFPSSVETFGNVTLEAMASGLPVIVESGCSGHLVNDGVNGFAVQAGDADAFFRSTYELVVNSSLRNHFSDNSRSLSLTMEKRLVVQKMLDNYTRVTDEFFTEYGGHHASRDAAYQNPDSFRAGNHPRPMALVIVEWVFIILFQVIYRMTSTFFYMQETFRPSARSQASVEPETKVVSHIGPITLRQQDNKENDDSTITTSDSTEDEDSATPSSGVCCSSSSSTAMAGSRISHALSKSFISAVEYQCRLESQARNACRSFVSRGGPSALLARKRKNSNFDTSFDDDLDDMSLVVAHGGPSRLRRNQSNAVTVEV